MDTIRIRGARTHNLRGIDLDLPRDALVVITGPVRRSGKSSLAFDTCYAEGQRRYVESLSAYARQFLSVMEKPDVDQIDGLSPAISIEQKTTSHNPRSTVGTITEIYDYLRLLFARVGRPALPRSRRAARRPDASRQMVDRDARPARGQRVLLLAPVVRRARASTGHAQGAARAGLRAGARRRRGGRARRRPAARHQEEPLDRGRGGPLQGATRIWSSGWPNPSRRRSRSATASRSWPPWTAGGGRGGVGHVRRDVLACATPAALRLLGAELEPRAVLVQLPRAGPARRATASA